MKKSIYSLLFCGLFLLMGCNNDDDGVSFHYEALKIIRAEVPEEFELYQVYDISVVMLRPDDCTLIDGFDITKPALTTRDVVAIGTVLEKNECTDTNQEVTQSFRFEVLYQNDYLFRFYTGEDPNGDPQYIELEVPVRE